VENVDEVDRPNEASIIWHDDADTTDRPDASIIAFDIPTEAGSPFVITIP
jgi:hypothetical protein